MYGKELKAIRELYGYSLLDVEKQTGISHQNLSRWENDKISPNIDFCVRLADFYNVTLDQLIGREKID